MSRFILALVFVFSIAVYGGDKAKTSSDKIIAQYEKIEANLLVGLASGNKGLMISSAYYLGEMKSKKAVIPLMEKLQEMDCNCTELRIVAALSLIKIGDARGVYLVKRTAELDGNPRVKRFSTIFYNAFVNPQQPDSVRSTLIAKD